jgi:hypothetical protein
VLSKIIVSKDRARCSVCGAWRGKIFEKKIVSTQESVESQLVESCELLKAEARRDKTGT